MSDRSGTLSKALAPAPSSLAPWRAFQLLLKDGPAQVPASPEIQGGGAQLSLRRNERPLRRSEDARVGRRSAASNAHQTALPAGGRVVAFSWEKQSGHSPAGADSQAQVPAGPSALPSCWHRGCRSSGHSVPLSGQTEEATPKSGEAKRKDAVSPMTPGSFLRPTSPQHRAGPLALGRGVGTRVA